MSALKSFIDNLLVRIHFIIVMIRWTGLAPWEFEFPFPGSLTSTFLAMVYTLWYILVSWYKPLPVRTPCVSGLLRSEPAVQSFSLPDKEKS